MEDSLKEMKIIPGGRFMDPIYKKRWGFNHLAVDYYAVFTPVHAHLDGEVIGWQWGPEGGWWLLFRSIDGYTIRAAHHQGGSAKLGHFKEGDVIAWTGNTGTHRDGTSNSPHWHCEVINPLGVHIDPEWYFNSLKNNSMIDYQNSIVRNIDTGGFYFFKGTKAFKMARQPLSPNTVGFALITLKQVWGDKDYKHIYEMSAEKMKEYAIVWEFFGGEDQSYVDANKNG